MKDQVEEERANARQLALMDEGSDKVVLSQNSLGCYQDDGFVTFRVKSWINLTVINGN